MLCNPQFQNYLGVMNMNDSKLSPGNKRKDLPLDFIPGEFDVICGKGKTCFNHIGNKRFRLTVDLYLDRYSAATSKLEKSAIVSSIIQTVRRSSPYGGFVKRDSDTGYWYEVGEHLSREKVGQTIRDALHFKYKSSTKAKKKRRQAEAQLKAAAQTAGGPQSLLAMRMSGFHHTIPNMHEATVRDLYQDLAPTSSLDHPYSDMMLRPGSSSLDVLNELSRLRKLHSPTSLSLQRQEIQRQYQRQLPHQQHQPFRTVSREQTSRSMAVRSTELGLGVSKHHSDPPEPSPLLLQEMLKVQQDIIRLQSGMIQGNINPSDLYNAYGTHGDIALGYGRPSSASTSTSASAAVSASNSTSIGGDSNRAAILEIHSDSDGDVDSLAGIPHSPPNPRATSVPVADVIQGYMGRNHEGQRATLMQQGSNDTTRTSILQASNEDLMRANLPEDDEDLIDRTKPHAL